MGMSVIAAGVLLLGIGLGALWQGKGPQWCWWLVGLGVVTIGGGSLLV
jgi:hypothetical protein